MKTLSRFLPFACTLSLLCSTSLAADTDQWPVPLEVAVSFGPTPVPSGGRTHLVYEVLLRNFGSESLAIRRIEVLDADARGAKPLAVFEGPELDSIVQAIGSPSVPEGTPASQLASGASAIVFMWVSFDATTKAPDNLRHRVFTADNAVEGPAVGTRTGLRVLHSPVTGVHWLGADAPSNDPDNHHRRGMIVMDGHLWMDRRFATDWKQVENGASFSGDKRDKRAYYAYGKPLLAVADARVVAVRDGFPDNVPGHNEEFHPAVPITLATILGNSVILDIGNGQFAHYYHLEAGSLKVKAGDNVRRGQLLGNIGNSGDAREPHLHFELTTSATPIAGEGLPYVIDAYRISATGDQPAGRRTRELPLKDEIVDFEPAPSAPSPR